MKFFVRGTIEGRCFLVVASLVAAGLSYAAYQIKKYSATGNRTPVSRVTGGDTHHYTIVEMLKFSSVYYMNTFKYDVINNVRF